MNILVTGSSRGIGFAVVSILAAEGHRVFATQRRSGGQIDELAAIHPNVVPLEMDVEDEETVREASLKVKELSPGLDAVISNAGILCPSDRVNLVTSLDIGELAAMLSVNTLGAARVIRYFDPLMRDGGVFATITSEAGEISNPFPELPGYCVSKAAANKLVSIQRITVSRYHVFAIHPGRVDTDMGHSSAQITPMESARGICDIVTGKKPIPQEAGWFINYRGESMPI